MHEIEFVFGFSASNKRRNAAYGGGFNPCFSALSLRTFPRIFTRGSIHPIPFMPTSS